MTTGAHAATEPSPHRSPLPPGELRAMVGEHLRRHPGLDFSPAELANVLGRPRSRGAIINACKRLVELGQAVRTRQAPQRYQAHP